MRIVYAFDRLLPSRWTDSEQAVNTVAALARRGIDVTLLVPRARGASGPSASELCEYYQVEGDFRVESIECELAGWDDARKLSHALRLVNERTAREADLLYTRNVPAVLAGLRAGLPTVYETYRPWAAQFPVLRPLFRRALRHPRFVGAVLHSAYARDRYLELGVAPERLSVVHNGYDPRRFSALPPREALRAELGLPPERPVALYAGHVNATKGLEVVLGMARRCPDVLFVLVGSERRGLVERLAERLPNVRVVGWQRFDATVRWLCAADVLLQPPSRVPLGLVGNTVLPMKLFLYLAAAKPIVGPASADVAELLLDGDNALLVRAGDTLGACSALRRILDDEALAARLSARARETAAGLTWDARAEKIERFLRSRRGVPAAEPPAAEGHGSVC